MTSDNIVQLTRNETFCVNQMEHIQGQISKAVLEEISSQMREVQS